MYSQASRAVGLLPRPRWPFYTVVAGLAIAALVAIAAIWALGDPPHAATAGASEQGSTEAVELAIETLEHRERIPVPPPTQGPAPAIRFQTQDSRGLPASDVHLFWRKRSGTFVDIGTTNREGSLDAAPLLDHVEPAQVVAKRAGLATTSTVVDSPHCPQTVVIVVEGGSRIVGVVRRDDGRRVDGTLTVVAWPAETRAPRVADGWEGTDIDANQLLAFAAIDADGAFELNGLASDRSYALAAGGSGYMSRGPPLTASPSAEPCLITVFRLYGAILCFEESSGASPKVSAAVSVTRPTSWKLEVPNTTFVGMPVGGVPLEAALAGVDGSHVRLPEQCTLFLYTAPVPESDALGPLLYTGSFAGYHPVTMRLMLTPLSRGLSTYRAQLVSSCSGRGELEVVFGGEHCASQIGGPMSDMVGRIRLRSSSSDVFEIPIRDASRNRFVFENIPAARYEATFQAEHMAFIHPEPDDGPVFVEVGHAPARFEVPCSDLGSIRVGIARQDGSDYNGRAEIMVGRGNARSGTSGVMRLTGGFTRFAEGPYEIRMVRSGAYTLALHKPAGDAFVVVSVPPGGVATADFVLRN